MAKWLRRLRALPRFVAALEMLRSDVQDALRNEMISKAWKRFLAVPAVIAVVPRLEAEWQEVERLWDEMR